MVECDEDVQKKYESIFGGTNLITPDKKKLIL
jgi:hypothetical protein